MLKDILHQGILSITWGSVNKVKVGEVAGISVR